MQQIAFLSIAIATFIAVALFDVDGRQMHAGISYHRYLVERDAIRQELDDWKASFGEMAKSNGWMPIPSTSQEERSIDDDEEEDHLQRFYMTKENIASLQALNPNANFSTNTPFTLLTNDEFAAYVGKAYRAVNPSDASNSATSRRLDGWEKSSSTQSTYESGSPTSGETFATTDFPSNSQTPGSNRVSKTSNTVTKTGADGKSVTTTTTTTSLRPGEESTKVTTSSGPSNLRSNFGFGSDLSSFWQQWGNGFNFGGMGRNEFQPDTVKPAGIDSSPSLPVAPSAPVPAPSAPVPAPSAPVPVPVPAPRAPVPAPRAPVPAPRAPVPAPRAPRPFPVAPAATPTTPETKVSFPSKSLTPTAATTVKDTSVLNEVDWSTSKCMSPIQNQGICGDCWAFATTAAVESGQCIKNGKKSLTKYSEQQLASCDRRNAGCSGGAPVYAMQYVQQNGFCTAKDYPYTSSDGRAASCMRCSAVDTGITGFEKVSGASDLASVVSKQPVIVAVASGNSVWKQYTGGVISSCDTNGLDHAVVVVGYTDSEWKIRNSWGDYWGENGYIRLARTSDGSGTCGMYGDMSYPTF